MCIMNRIRKLQRKKAFTLVEVVIVLVILAILAAVLVPTLTGYIDKAKEKAIISETKGIMTAAQAAVSELYATYRQTNADGTVSNFTQAVSKTNFRVWNADGTKTVAKRVTNNMFYTYLQGRTPTADQVIDFTIAEQVLKYLDSEKGNANAVYNLKRSNTSACPDAANNTSNTVEWYEREKKQPAIIIAYTPYGEVLFVEFGHDGMLCHIGSDGTIVTSKNGLFSHYPCTHGSNDYNAVLRAHGGDSIFG